jgi:hypothetical protein
MKANKYEVSDPAYYDPLIANQKKRVRNSPGDVDQWLELGRLHEAKLGMTNNFARNSFGFRYFLYIYALFFLLFIAMSIHVIPAFYNISSSQMVVQSIGIGLVILLFPYLWSLRYPPSGSKYFRKVVSIDRGCGEAYMHLGLIALRRWRKREGCELLEQAIKVGVNNVKIERELNSIYQKEFFSFFNKKNERDINQKKLIEQQADNIRELRLKVSSIERKNKNLIVKIDQSKWETIHDKKLLKREMNAQIEDIKESYEEQISSMGRDKSNPEEEKEQSESHFVKLTTEIMEAKAELEKTSLSKSKKALEEIMGQYNWQSLSEQTRTYLATAEHIFSLLKYGEEDPDYSLVGMEICKALETELNKRLIEPFIGYMNGNKSEFLRINQNGECKGKPTYFNYLAKLVDNVNYPQVDSLGLGQCLFVLKLVIDGDYALSEYTNFLIEKCGDTGSIIEKPFLKKLETVIQRYRNAIAHQAPLNREEYEDLRDLIVTGEGALLTVVTAL